MIRRDQCPSKSSFVGNQAIKGLWARRDKHDQARLIRMRHLWDAIRRANLQRNGVLIARIGKLWPYMYLTPHRRRVGDAADHAVVGEAGLPMTNTLKTAITPTGVSRRAAFVSGRPLGAGTSKAAARRLITEVALRIAWMNSKRGWNVPTTEATNFGAVPACSSLVPWPAPVDFLRHHATGAMRADIGQQRWFRSG